MTATQEVEKHQPLEVERIEPARSPTQRGGNSPSEAMRLLQLAIEQKLPPEAIERLYNLVERATKDQAEREFHAAKCAFQAELRPIRKTGRSDQFKRAARDGGTEPYQYLELPEIAEAIRPLCDKYGFSYRWDEAEEPKNGLVSCVCWVSHKGGHREPTRFSSPIESKAGCSGQQKMAAATTYGQRYSLVAAFGITGVNGKDTDGYAPEATNGGGEPQRRADNGPPFVTEDQVKELEQLLQDAGKTPAQLFGWLRVQARRLYDLREPDYARAKTRLEEIAYERLLKKSEAELKNGLRQPGEEYGRGPEMPTAAEEAK
jgi:hypothetical protein